MTNQIYILPDRKRPDPDEVAAAFNKQVEEELRRKELEEKLRQKTGSKLEEKVEKTETKIPASLEDICKGYEEYMAWEAKTFIIPRVITDKYRLTSKQIKQFSKILIKYKDLEDFVDYTAKYLTALMLSSQDKKFVIDLTELNKEKIELKYLGYKLKDKNLTINGNAGDYVGYDAENCPITVNGNAGDYVGYDAKNCPITVNGNAGDNVGLFAKNCQITVNGNARYDVGNNAKNCQIKIKEEIGGLSYYIGEDTEIYQWKNNKWEKIY